jgi:hypothetical protein
LITLGGIEMSREHDVDALEELSHRLISPYPTDVTKEGMKYLELMLERRMRPMPHPKAHDRSALAVASRELDYWSARRASARVVPSPADTTEVR